MTVEKLRELAAELLDTDANRVIAENAASDELIGLRFYDAPLIGVADAADPMFRALRLDGVQDPAALAPEDVLPSAKSVISWFLPMSGRVRRDNAKSVLEMSDAWRQARIEGQEAVLALGDAICRALEAEGFLAVQPARSDKFKMLGGFCSNWSERHVAHIAGLGTFGLSRGLITERGMAGRIGSVVTNASLPPTERKYSSPFEYCVMCGACARRCPAEAIDPEKGVAAGKDQVSCWRFLEAGRVTQRCGSGERSRYGCGKCQTGVPCESGIPGKT